MGSGNTDLWLMCTRHDCPIPDEVAFNRGNIETLKKKLVERLRTEGAYNASARLEAAYENFQASSWDPQNVTAWRYIASPFRHKYNSMHAFCMLQGKTCARLADKVALVLNSGL
jgi:hypothetical protein